MKTLEAILSRRSIRKFTGQPVDDETIRTLLTAAMAGPSAVNARPWSFLVVRGRETLNKMAEANGRSAAPLKEAPLAIMVCGDLDQAFSRAPDYWITDASIAAQNILLAAHELGLGAVWLGTWPQEEKVAHQKELFALPESIVPYAIVALGYPAEARSDAPRPGYEAERVHYEKW